jgi:peptide/nickel transport system substrate-binding protein
MKKKILWMLVSCLMILALIIESCGPKEEEEAKVTEEGGQIVTTKGEVEEEEVIEKEEGLLPPEVPKYGGWIRQVAKEPKNFDPSLVPYTLCMSLYWTNEELICGDWAKGPAGTGEADWFWGCGGRMELMTGWLAESWETPDDQTIIFHIRKDVHWHNKPPVNGRELTADDVAWCINREFTSPKAYSYALAKTGNGPTSVKALDKSTVEVKVPTEALGVLLLEIGDHMFIYPPDMIEAYGDMNDWKLACGTGAWVLTDYVPSVSVTYSANPDYWQKDPIHPENQLPYPDGYKGLVMADLSTQLASFRTGKIDLLDNISWENFELLKDKCPELQYKKKYKFYSFLSGREDKPELPFKDVRVRRALNLAVNQQEIIDDYYNGNADLLLYPCGGPLPVFKPYYIPLEEQPESVQELFTYNPEKARQLLAEAGYPNGFKTVVQTTSANVDFLSLIREYFLDVGVDMEIEVLESSVFSGVSMGRTHKEMIYNMIKPDAPWMLYEVRPDQMWCPSFWESERTKEAWDGIRRALGRDDDEVARIMKDIGPHILDNAWGVWTPIEQVYVMWWPWFQNYRGEWAMGYLSTDRNWTFIWIDNKLKESMGY